MPPPPRPHGLLSGLGYDALMYQRQLPPTESRNMLGFLELDTLDALESASRHSESLKLPIARIQAILERGKSAALSVAESDQCLSAYKAGVEIALPTLTALLRWMHQFVGLARENSLNAISALRIRDLDLASLTDTPLQSLLQEVRAALSRVKNLDDVQGFGQAYEAYGEALVYSLLKAKFETSKIEEVSTSTPDFACSLKNGKKFFVELKALDIVGGSLASKELLVASLEPQIELERQTAEGRKVAIAESEISSFKKPFSPPGDHDPRSLITVIEAFVAKARSAFKGTQFAQGPTFAVALCNRILVPGGRHDVAPYYYDRGHGGAVVSGVLWQACFGRPGTPILRVPDFEGSPGLEGHLARDGLLVDKGVVFPGGALMFVDTQWGRDDILGLYDSEWKPNDPTGTWTSEDTEEVIHTLCTACNDERNSFGQLVAAT